MLSFGNRYNFDVGSGTDFGFGPGSGVGPLATIGAARFGGSDLVARDSFDAGTGVRGAALSVIGGGLSDRGIGFNRSEDLAVANRSYGPSLGQTASGRFIPDIRGFRSGAGYDPRLVYADMYPLSSYGYGPEARAAYPYPGAMGPYPAPATYYRGSLPPFYRERLGEPYGPQMPCARSPCATGRCGSRYGGPISEYPPASPECMPYMSCTSSANPNDCRSCVSSLGGADHCATQICGPHYY